MQSEREAILSTGHGTTHNHSHVDVDTHHGLRGIEGDTKGYLDAVFRLAEKHGKPIDIHLHARDLMGAFSMEEIIARTRAQGMQGKVTLLPRHE